VLIPTMIIAQNYDTNPDDIFNVVFFQDLEHHDAPIEYTTELWYPDWNQHLTTYGRMSDRRGHGWWDGKLQDSILIDPLSSSKVMKFSWEDTIADGYDGQIERGGDLWKIPLGDEYSEIYFSYNILWRPGFDMTHAGKMPGVYGGSEIDGMERPAYGEGFNAMLMWQHNPSGGIGFYAYYQEGSQPDFGTTFLWDSFQPSGTNLNYNGGSFIFDRSEPIWYNITIRCVINSFTNGQPNRDGILEGYVNGRLIEQVSGLYLLTAPDINKGVNGIEFSHFFGGGGPPLRDEWSYIDDVVVWTYDESVDVPRGNTLSPPNRVLDLPNSKDATTVDIDIPTMPAVLDVSIIDVSNTNIPNIAITEAKISSFGQTEIYDYGLTITRSEEPIADELLILATQDNSKIWNTERASRGLKALYFFDEGDGNQILDNSGTDPLVNLEIQNSSMTDWLPGRGLKIEGSTIISSNDVPTELINSITSTNEI